MGNILNPPNVDSYNKGISRIMVRFYFLSIFAFSIAFPLKVIASDCESVSRLSPYKALSHVAVEAAKIGYYPLMRGVSLYPEIVRPLIQQHGLKGLARIPDHWLRKDAFALATLALINWVDDEEDYLSGLEYVDKTQDLLPESKENGVIVLIDGFKGNDPMRLSALYMRLAAYKGYKNVYYVRGDWNEVETKLSEIKEKHGGADLVDFVSHGTDGGLLSSVGEENTVLRANDLYQSPVWRGLIKDGGAFRDFGCQNGTNHNFNTAFGYYVFAGKGTLVASNVNTSSNLSQYILGAAEMAVGDLPAPLTSAAKFFDAPADRIRSWIHNTKTITVEPLYRKEFENE